VPGGAGGEGIDAGLHALLVDVHDELPVVLFRHAVAEADHLLEFPGGVDVHERERRLAGREGLQGQVQHHGGILADGIEHHRVFELGRDLADDVDGFGLELFQVREALFGEIHHGNSVKTVGAASAANPAVAGTRG